MFFALTIISAIWIPLWLIFFRDDPAQSQFVSDAELKHIRGGVEAQRDRHSGHVRHGFTDWRLLLTNRTLLANYWAFFVFGYFLFFFMTWLPNYLAQTYHLNVKEVGLFTILPWASAAVLLVALGYFSDYLLSRTGSLRISRSMLIGLTQLLAALAVIPIGFTNNLTVAIACITVAVAFSMGANASYYAVNVDIVPGRAATALGIMDTGFALSGFLAPAITGWVVPRIWVVSVCLSADGRPGAVLSAGRTLVPSSRRGPRGQAAVRPGGLGDPGAAAPIRGAAA